MTVSVLLKVTGDNIEMIETEPFILNSICGWRKEEDSDNPILGEEIYALVYDIEMGDEITKGVSSR